MTTILGFNKTHIEQARELILANYNEERSIVIDLPQIDAIPIEEFDEFTDNKLGVVMFDGEKMLGFMCCYNPWNNAFDSTAKGTFVPTHAHGSISENRGMIYKKLYQTAAEIWVKHGITYHSIGLYAHNLQAKDAFFACGFGLRCIDFILLHQKADASLSKHPLFVAVKLHFDEAALSPPFTVHILVVDCE